MSRSKKKSKKTTRQSRRPRPTKSASEGGRGAATGRRRKAPVLLIALAGVAVVAVVVALVVWTRGPGEAPGVAQMQSAGRETTELDLRDEAFDVARKLLEDFPGSADPLGLMGTVQNQFGNSAEAEEWWRRCLERDPRRVDIYEVLAVAFLRKGEYEKVAELLDREQTLGIHLPSVHLRYAEALLEMGRLDEALSILEEEMKRSPDLTDKYVIMGKIRFQRKEYEQAVEAYAEAARRRPRESHPYYGLATASARLGQSDKAREYMETFKRLRAVEDDASATRRRATHKMRPAAQILSQVLVDAGRVYEARKQYEQAETYWRRAATLDPANTASRIQLVNRYRSTQRARDAVEVCEQLRRLDPDNATYHLVTGMTLADLRQFDAALAAMQRAIELDPDDERIQKAYQRLLERQ